MTADPPARLPAVDSVKAAAILAVMLTHAVPGFFDGPVPEGALQALLLSGFHVPAFLFVSGFLAKAETPVGWQRVAARWSRILPAYFVASGVAWLLGLVLVPTARILVFKIVTGAVFGHYYFIPILALCFLLLPLLSRLTAPVLMLTAVVLMALAEVLWARPEWRPSATLFWQIRDPVLQFHLGHFVLGLIAARYRRQLARGVAGHTSALAIAAGIGLVGYAWLVAAHPAVASHPAARTTYTLMVIACLAALTPRRPAPAAVRFLSDTTLTIYLYHWFAYLAVMPRLGPMPLGLRMVLLAGVGLAFGSSIAVAGQRLLAGRSRLLLGA
jgi:peptidoglycan/LPS O-acetylase OafA/YrhL